MKPYGSISTLSFDELKLLHMYLETRLEELSKLRSRSPEEEYEIRIIKKRKLAIKDQMASMQ